MGVIVVLGSFVFVYFMAKLLADFINERLKK